MDDKKEKLDNVVRLSFVKSADRNAGEENRAFPGRFKKDVVLHAQRGQAKLDRAYKMRSRKLVERLRNEVLTKLMIEGKKH